jgi:hypothetical protein
MSRWMATLILIALSGFSALLPEDQDLATRLWNEQLQQYKEWPLVPGTQVMMPGHAPHGKFVTIHANRITLDAMASGRQRLPEGAILAKENFNTNREMVQVTAMVKRAEGWYWAVYQPDGTIEKAGVLEGCVVCHEGARRDSVFTWQ